MVLTVQRFESSVLAHVALSPTLIHLTLDTSSLPAAPTPGQFFMARCEAVYLRRPLFPCHIEAGRAAVLLPLGQDLGLTWLATRRVGEMIDLLGPLGRGFVLEGDGGHLLLVCWGSRMGPLLALAEWAVAEGWTAALLAGVERPDLAVPTALLPPAVEYQVAVGTTAWEELEGLLRDALPWADRICAAGGRDQRFAGRFYSRLAAAIREVRLGLQPGLAQVVVEVAGEGGVAWGCGVGACGACAVETRRGLRRACYHGPVFDLAELVV